MGRWWIVGAVLLLGWVIISMYYLASGAPLELPTWLEPYVPFIGIAAFAVAIFMAYRRPLGTPSSPYALPAAISGALLATLVGMTIVNWDGGSRDGIRWLLGTIAWAPIAIVLFVLWRRSLRR